MKLAVTILIFCVAALLALGMVMLYSSSMALNGARLLVQQSVWCGLGLAACLVMALLDYRLMRRFWWVLFGAAVALLALVLVCGSIHGHARRWFSHGGVSFQPSEFGKVALIIALAWYGERYQRQMGKWIRGILIPGAMIGVTASLIFKEPDVGNALLVCAVGGILLLLSGI
ncbi:MAG: FtsW/RodA/SpoVE family cell cycle protein, partial [Limisphaerales bacterium]